MINKIVEWTVKDFNKEVEAVKSSKSKRISKKEVLSKYDWSKFRKQKEEKEEYEYTPQWKINKKMLNFFKNRYMDTKGNMRFLSLIPIMLIGFIGLINLFTQTIPFEDMLQEAKWAVPTAIVISWIMFLTWYFYEFKSKRLFEQFSNWTIKTKEIEIIRFKRYIPNNRTEDTSNYNRYDNSYRIYDRSDYWFTIIASDWKEKYESEKLSDYELWLDYSKVYNAMEPFRIANNKHIMRILRLIGIIKDNQISPREYITIKNKKYSIWDKITVYIDSKIDWNYLIYIPELYSK